jgi:hypothetical protein
MADPTDVILGATMIVTTTTIIRKLRENSGPQNARGNAVKEKKSDRVIKPLIFGFMLTVALLAISLAAPTAALLLAYLSLVGAFVLNGPALFAMIGGLGR